LLRRARDISRRNRHAFGAQKFLGLIFVNVHSFSDVAVIVVPAVP
jgi:hypothetical protein